MMPNTTIPNPAHKGMESQLDTMKTDIDKVLNHLFDLNHDFCEDVCKDNKHIRLKGHFCTCMKQQADIRAVVQQKILGRLHELYHEGIGVQNTNQNESIGKVVLSFRDKSTNWHALHNMLAESLGLLHSQELHLYRLDYRENGEPLMYMCEIFEQLEAALQLPRYSLADVESRRIWREQLEKRHEVWEKRSSAEHKVKLRKRRAAKRKADSNSKMSVKDKALHDQLSFAATDLAKAGGPCYDAHHTERFDNLTPKVAPKVVEPKRIGCCKVCKMPGHTENYCDFLLPEDIKRQEDRKKKAAEKKARKKTKSKTNLPNKKPSKNQKPWR
jgi:hypothetical protein